MAELYTLGIMRAFATFLLLGFLACLVASCSSVPRVDSPEVIARARSRVLDQLPDLDIASRDMILTNAPKIVFVGTPFDLYTIYKWTITSNRVVTLDTYNKPIDRLESARVRIR